MAVRMVLGGCLAAALSLALPSSADVYDDVVSAAAQGTEDVTGWCTFSGTTTPEGDLQFAYGGHAVATSTGARPPEATVITCTLESPAQGLPGEEPTKDASVSVAGPGAVSAAAGTTPPWPVRPVRICVSGYAVFDPIMPVQVDIPEQCRWSTI